ncbi:MAG: hypothetical protein ACKVOB_06665 [Sphingomonas sp.]
MSDELESKIDVRDYAPDSHYGETLLYDFAKTLTSLSLIVLGGVLSLGGTQRAAEIPQKALVLTSGSIAMAGLLALSTAFAIVEARTKNRALPTYLPTMIKAANFLLGIGLGAFMIIWLESLK